jgi:ssDNA-binding Zn-finger/Zn-ribbon topoisomerase 1
LLKKGEKRIIILAEHFGGVTMGLFGKSKKAKWTREDHIFTSDTYRCPKCKHVYAKPFPKCPNCGTEMKKKQKYDPTFIDEMQEYD